ncbi:hypothetical protein M441DRAFT_29718 [Trichoderma asperellum CBS 433.97]|uniref:Uncharacterized protein n=1 Tax=Trichoderma asperellum (strain ATCC 204424 / CBS 433.97 / NBRC 101777) TaxID=1042311 RepID=A0A2T3Z0J0_TRIA4|nr:hypothetical protein M441DRAFT_29718 [Trichoderma asperellum CBS 433.97]PTB38339.1 hypothetical protein M441DRAFT_29718 [Trichoderma asperellum CBS 433.97]
MDNKDKLKKAIELYNEFAAEASRASDVARICDDNKVAGIERGKVAQRPSRSLSLDQISLVKQIDKLKAEFGEKTEYEPEDPLIQSPALAHFSPFSKPESRGPPRGQSQQWQREHLRSDDPQQRELEELFEEPSSPRFRQSKGPYQHPSRSQSFQSQSQQSQQSRSRYRSQPSGSQPSRSHSSRSQSSRSQPPGSQPPGSQSSQSQPQQYQQQQPMRYKNAPRQHHRQRQRTNSWPRTQGLENLAAHGLAYVPEAPREAAALSINHGADTAMLELQELPSGARKGKDRVARGDYGLGPDPVIDVEANKKKVCCSNFPKFPGWKNWFTRRGDE